MLLRDENRLAADSVNRAAMEHMQAFGRRIAQVYKTLAILALNGVVIFVALDLGSRALFGLRHSSTSADEAPDPRAKSSYYLDKPWAAQYWREFALSRRSRYHSYVVWRRAPFAGTTINIDEDGLRRTPGARCRSDSYKVFTFGSST